MKQASQLFTASLQVILQLKNSRGKSLSCFLSITTNNMSLPIYRITRWLRLEGTTGNHLVQPQFRTVFNWVLNRSTDRLPYLSSATSQLRSFPTFQRNFLYFKFISLPFPLSFHYSVSLAIPPFSIFGLIHL